MPTSDNKRTDAATRSTATIMFTDIVSSTTIAGKMSDDQYAENVRRPHHARLKACFDAYKGQVLKDRGDGFLVRFNSAIDALRSAMAIQDDLAANPIPTPRGSVRVRIGLHTGEVVVTPDDVIGLDVTKAERISALATGGQVLLSEQTRGLVRTLPAGATFYDWRRYRLKGFDQPHRVYELLWADRRPTRPPGSWGLPQWPFLSTFIGRETEMQTIIAALRSHRRGRLVTLAGPGGVGKTRLAWEVASRMADDELVGAAVGAVSLQTAENSEAGVWRALLAGLEIDLSRFGAPTEREAVARWLGDKPAVLILDNCETVPCAAAVLRDLLVQCRQLTILATSQTSFGLDFEQTIEINPMDVPDTTAPIGADIQTLDSYKLFLERAQLVERHWQPKDDDLPVLADILRLTDGLPLAIELAAAWVDRGPLTELRDGLQEKRKQYFARRKAGTAADPRHESLLACVQWSWGLLDDEAKRLAPQLSVFAGSFSAESAATVCGQPNAADILDRLCDRSLLRWFEDETLRTKRYKILPTIAASLGDLLDDEKREQLRDKHLAHFLSFLDRNDDLLKERGRQMQALAAILADVENIRAALRWVQVKEQWGDIARLASAFSSFLEAKGWLTEWFGTAQLADSAAASIGDRQLRAMTQNNLGVAYRNLPTGDRGENLRRAIACFQAALRVRTEKDFPRQWAMIQNNLGNAYADLPTGDRGENLRRAIECYDAALRVYTEKDFPLDWAMTQNNLGAACAKLPTGDRGENLHRAIACYEAALRVRTEKDFPLDWAGTQNNLGTAYADLPTGDRGENLRRAIACYEAALRVYTEKDFSLDWAMTQNNLGIAYQNLPTGDRGENLRRAIACYEAALRVYTEKDFPLDWAMTQNNLGIAYANLPTGDRGGNLRRAIACFEGALRVRTERDFPLDWAATQNNLGAAYADLPTGDRGENLRRAISCFEAALRVKTEKDFPLDWAMTQNNLGNAYGDLPTGDRGENLKRAIECYEAALRVRTEENFPLQWAETCFNLGLLYLEGDALELPRKERMARARECFEKAERGFRAVGAPADADEAAALAARCQEDQPK